MNWLIFVIIGFFFWATNSIISKILLNKYITNILVYAIFLGLVSVLPVVVVPLKPITIPNLSLSITCLITGMLYVAAIIPYLKAISIEEISRVAPILRFIPLFVLILSIVFLDEQLTNHELVAFFILVLGGLLISIHKTKDTFKISTGFYFMLLSCLLFSIYNILAKWIYTQVPYYDGFMLIRIGSVLGALMLLLVTSLRVQFINTFSQMPTKIKQVAVVVGIFNVSGHVFLNLAIFIAPISLVTASGGVHSIVVLLLTLLLSHKYPHILKENFTTPVLLQKSVAILLIVIGAGMIVLY